MLECKECNNDTTAASSNVQHDPWVFATRGIKPSVGQVLPSWRMEVGPGQDFHWYVSWVRLMTSLIFPVRTMLPYIFMLPPPKAVVLRAFLTLWPYDQTAIGGIWTQCWQTVPLNVHVPEHVTDTSTDKSSSQVLELLIRKIIGCRISEAEANAEITAVTVSWCIESGWLIK